MGRYYNGDIEGKFWFGVQDSNDADFFGSEGSEPNYIEYYFDKETHMDSVKEGVKKCLKELGENKEKLDKFFKENNGYNDEMLAKAGLNRGMIEWYARFDLGLKIQKCLEENGECSFEAEL